MLLQYSQHHNCNRRSKMTRFASKAISRKAISRLCRPKFNCRLTIINPMIRQCATQGVRCLRNAVGLHHVLRSYDANTPIYEISIPQCFDYKYNMNSTTICTSTFHRSLLKSQRSSSASISFYTRFPGTTRWLR